MLVKFKNIKVDVFSAECLNYQCFSPHKYSHQGRTIDGKDNSWADKHFSCSHRNYHGCPDNPKLK